MLRSVVRTIAAGSVAAAIFACGGSDNSTGPTTVFTSVSVTPVAPSVSVGSTVALSAGAKDQNGAAIASGSAAGATWSSSNTAAATVNAATGVVTGVANGTSTISASITIGSVTHTGSQPVTVNTPAANGDVTATSSLAFDPSALTVARSAGTSTVTWHFQSVAHTVTWDAQPGSEVDIPATSSANVARAFTVAGIYHYHCSIHPSMTGTITVQ